MFPAHDAHDGIAPELLPPTLSLTVVHHQIRISQFARRAKIENAMLHRALENERGIAERAIGDGYRRIPDNVVHNLVPDQNAQGICSCITADGERNDRLRVADAGRPSGCSAAVERLKARHVDRRNTIFARAARSDLLQRDGVLREIGAGPLRSPAEWLGRGSADSHCSQGTNRSHHQHRRPDAVPESQWLAAEDLYFVSAPPDRDLRRFRSHYSLDRPTRLRVRVTFSLTEVRLSCSQHG